MPQRYAEVCGQCHSCFFPTDPQEWWKSGWRGQYRPGEELEATRTLLRYVASDADSRQPNNSVSSVDNFYWPDGTARVGGREFLGLIESGCYQRGEMTCLSCHSMHEYTDPDDQLAADMAANQACLQCHKSMTDRIEQHTYHNTDSSGSQCRNCHMPHTSYALFKAIRSHRISPSATMTRDSGRPNACHLDRPLEWTAAHLSLWYNQPSVELDSERSEISDAVIWLLRGDAMQRSIAVWATGWAPAREVSGTDWLVPYLIQLMQDPYPVIRLMSHRSLRTLVGYENCEYDFLDTADERSKACVEILNLWEGVGATAQQLNAVLLNEDGSLIQEEFRRLLSERDDRPVVISE